MGTAKVTLAVLLYAMAANMVEVARWRLRQAGIFCLDAAREIKTRIPRRHTRNRLRASASRGEAQRSRTAQSLIASLGLAVDLATGEILADQLPPQTS
jgi:hypothetical protein